MACAADAALQALIEAGYADMKPRRVRERRMNSSKFMPIGPWWRRATAA
jgi:hypothetical protein